MRKIVIFAFILFVGSSCTVTGKWTGTEYSIGANATEGFYIKAMPARWKAIKETANDLTEWAKDDYNP